MSGKAGIMLCGTNLAWESSFLSEMIGLAGVGGSVAKADGTTNADAGSWSRTLFSCITRGKPVRVTIAFSPRDNWINKLQAVASSWVATWPLEYGYTVNGTLTWSMKMTDFTFGGMLEDRMLAEVEICPNGAPTWVTES
jgi:hypothetical protein